MVKKLFILLTSILLIAQGYSWADNYNAEDLKAYAQEQEDKAVALAERARVQELELTTLYTKLSQLTSELDQVNTSYNRQRQVLDQWDSCDLCKSICKDKIKEEICSENQ